MLLGLYSVRSILTAQGPLLFIRYIEDGFETTLEAPSFEDMMFEPKGGPLLENHIFRGRINYMEAVRGYSFGSPNLIQSEPSLKD